MVVNNQINKLQTKKKKENLRIKKVSVQFIQKIADVYVYISHKKSL